MGKPTRDKNKDHNGHDKGQSIKDVAADVDAASFQCAAE
jgi:hypothetical protein